MHLAVERREVVKPGIGPGGRSPQIAKPEAEPGVRIDFVWRKSRRSPASRLEREQADESYYGQVDPPPTTEAADALTVNAQPSSRRSIVRARLPGSATTSARNMRPNSRT